MVIHSADDGVLIDLAVNAPPDLPASATPAGPTLAPEELAGHKLLALFDRAAARDFADIYVLARRFGKDLLLARAAQIDAGFDTKVLADMIATLDRFTDSEIPIPDGSSAAELRAQTAGQTLQAHFWHLTPCRCTRKKTTQRLPSNPVYTFSDATGSLHPQSRWPETVCSLARIRTSFDHDAGSLRCALRPVPTACMTTVASRKTAAQRLRRGYGALQDHFRVRRHDRVGGVTHEYRLVAQVFGTHRSPRRHVGPEHASQLFMEHVRFELFYAD